MLCPHQAEKQVDISPSKRCGGFVQDDETGVVEERFGDLEHGLPGHAKPFDRLPNARLKPQTLQPRLRIDVGRLPVKQADARTGQRHAHLCVVLIADAQGIQQFRETQKQSRL